MKTTRKTLQLLTAAAIMASLAVPAFAADAAATAAAAPAAPTFGVVDMNKVLQTTNAAKDVISQMESKRKEFQAQIAKEEEGLRTMEKDLAKQKETLAKEAFEEKYKALQEKFVQEQKMVQDRKRILDQAFSGALSNLRRESAKVVAGIAKDKHYSAVLTQDAVMISVPELDITDLVIEQMNKDVKKIPVDWSAATSAVTAPPAKKK